MSYVIDGVDVAFARRDITQATDEEISRIEAIIKAEKAMAGPGRFLSEMIIESDFIDMTCKYRLSTIVSGYGDVLDPALFDTST